MAKLILFLAASICISGSAALAASTDWRVHWRILATPHFDIFYNQKQRDLAEIYGIAAERAYDILKVRFSEAPSRTYLVIQDNTDFSNGFSTFLPYSLIEVYPVMPSSTISLDYYHDWPLGLLTHEYTHTLTFEPVHGYMKWFEYIFGSIVHPNGLLPRWYLEGLAVESESRFSSVGRLKSPRQFAELRALVEDDRLRREDIARINESLLPEYPFGERPYLFGSILWEHMMQKGPPDIVETLNQRYGRRVPFIINAPVQDLFGKKYDALLKDTYDEVEMRAKEQIAIIQKAGKENNRAFKKLEMEQFAPSISPDGHTLIFMASGFQKGQIRYIHRDGSESFSTLESKKLFATQGTTRMEWLPSNDGFIYDAVDEMDPYHSYHALYEYDLTHHKTKQLTHDLRAQDPGVSPSGRNVAFVLVDGGRHSLATLDRFSGAVKTLFTADVYERVSSPEFVDENEIAYTKRTVKGEEHLYVLNLLDGKTTMHFAKDTELRRPKMTKMGLLVETTSTGIQNLALADLVKDKLKPLTNTTTEIQTADWDKHAQEFVLTRFTGYGRKLVAMNAATDLPSVNPPNVGATNIASTVPATWPAPPELATISTADFKDESYNAAKYLWPRYWIPFVYPVYNGVYFQGSTTMSDPIGENTYTAAIAYDTVTSHGGIGLQYVNSSLPPDIELSYVKTEEWLGVLGDVQQDETYIGDLAFYLPGLSPHFKGMAGYMHDHVSSPFNGYLTRQGPIASLVFSNWDDPRVEGNGTILQVYQQQFMGDQSENVVYGRTFVQAVQACHCWLHEGHRIVATVKAAFAPDLPYNEILSLGDSSLGANYLVSLSTAQFLFRGYNNATFVGRKVVNWNLEYQFPLNKNYWGLGTTPFFSRGFDGVIFVDGIGVEGAAYDPAYQFYRNRTLNDVALSTGAEVHWNTTIGYQLPVTIIFGAYFGFDSQAHDSYMPFVGLALSDMTTVNNLKHHWFNKTATAD